ncbi:protein MICROTUBULE BINDING PROTEIN 2C-like [Rosa rugosa]|uniref:protein MICROTUBULE BINDING PROTEIN 2C-like n=1 Tax=Rosa rugosa TaxID=74645 RepID=UPI002B416458|nr:protein MICROTUBULE BINDING PROTEIN 2C-like [Rosa rugosa]
MFSYFLSHHEFNPTLFLVCTHLVPSPTITHQNSAMLPPSLYGHFGDLTDHHHHLTLSSSAANGNIDRVLFQELIEIIPLVQSLIDPEASSSFTRRGSVTYSKTPSRGSLSNKKVCNTFKKGLGIGRKITRRWKLQNWPCGFFCDSPPKSVKNLCKKNNIVTSKNK